MIEGEKSFDITLCWPERLRRDETDYPRHPGRRDRALTWSSEGPRSEFEHHPVFGVRKAGVLRATAGLCSSTLAGSSEKSFRALLETLTYAARTVGATW